MNRPSLAPPERLRPYLVAPLLLLLGMMPLLRLIGMLGVRPFASWRGAARHALAFMFAVTACAHFGKQRGDLVRMVPPHIPYPDEVVRVTGVLEFFGAFGLTVPQVAPLAGRGLIALLIAQFPANIHAARQQIGVGGKPATPLWFRTLVQVFFISLIHWSIARHDTTTGAPAGERTGEAD